MGGGGLLRLVGYFRVESEECGLDSGEVQQLDL